MRALIVVLVMLGSGCSDRSLAGGGGDDASDGGCIAVDCPCDAHDDCAPGTTCVDGRCAPTCGNGVVDPGEQCDAIDPACNSFCLVPGRMVERIDAPSALVRDIAIAPDGTLALVGSGADDPAGWIARMERSGEVLWEASIDGPNGAAASPTAVRVADDGDIIATGSAQSEGAWVHRYSSGGESRWKAHDDLEPGGAMVGGPLAVAGDHVFVVAFESDPANEPRSRLMRLDGAGDELWRLDLDPTSAVVDSWSIAVDDRGDAWIAGTIGDYEGAFLARIPEGTALLEPQPLDATLQDLASVLVSTPDAGIVVAGYDRTRGWAMQRARDGSSTWLWSSETPFAIYDVAADATGHVVLVGLAAQRGLVAKLRPDGSTAWTFVAPDNPDGSPNDPYHALAIDDDGFVYALTLTATPAGAITKLAP